MHINFVTQLLIHYGGAAVQKRSNILHLIYAHTMAWLCFKAKRTHVLNRAIESVVGSWSLAGGLVHRGGDNGSAWTTAGLSGAGGPVPGLVGVGGIGDGGRTDSGVVGAVGTALGGGVVGDSNSSEDRAGLPIPDSLRK